MHRRERHPRYMGSFVDFWVGIPEVAGDMKLIFICFALLTHLALLLCFRYFLEQWHLFGGCRTQWGPPVVLNPSPTTTSIFSTPRSFFRTLALFLAAKFLFLVLHHTVPVSRFRLNPQRLSSCRRRIGEVGFPPGSLSLEISFFCLRHV